MTKTVHPVLKKTGAVLLTVLVLVLMAVPAFAVALPDAPTGYVYDGANVLSSSTESYIERTGSALAEACGAEVVVATVDFTDGEDIADYAYDLFNKWGIGDKKSNNGLLILLSIGAEDYYAEPGLAILLRGSVRHFDYCAERAATAQTVLPQRLGCAAPAASDGRLLARTPSAARPGRSRIRRSETGWI